MAVTHTLAATFTQSIGKAITMPAGARSMFFFGTGGDGNNANRVLSGPTAVATGTPAYSTNYVTVGYNGTSNNIIDTYNQRNAAMLASGWTWAAVYRCTSAGSAGGSIIEDAGGGGGAVPILSNVSGMAFQNPGSLNTYIHAGGQAIRATHTMATSSGGWHFLAITYTGGAAGTYTLNDFTDNVAGGTVTTYVTSGTVTGNFSPCLGGNVPPGATTFTYLSDIAWAYVGTGAMIQTDLAALAAQVRPWLLRRGIIA